MKTSSTIDAQEKMEIDIDELLFYKLEKLSEKKVEAGLAPLFFEQGDTTPILILD